jgi:hypothetical protein
MENSYSDGYNDGYRQGRRYSEAIDTGPGLGTVLFWVMLCISVVIGFGFWATSESEVERNRRVSQEAYERSVNEDRAKENAKGEYINRIVATAAKAEQCDTPNFVQVSYRNETGRTIGKVKLNFRGYLPDRSSNIVQPSPNVNDSHVALDWVVKPNETRRDCVQLPLTNEGLTSTAEPKFHVRVVDFTFLEDVEGYADAFKEQGVTCPQVGPAPTSIGRTPAERSHNWLEVGNRRPPPH